MFGTTQSLVNGRFAMSSSSKHESIELHERIFEAEWDEEGVYFYQAYNDQIADWAIENQRQVHKSRMYSRTTKILTMR